ncbi:serine/threonine protein kinase [Mycobacterium sp. 852002-51163_SCH5372311]|uniref:serine/threonine-protein kinase n=1 Tax=Mycobacterium sp. 852002-51163_SCH5372311 TaxID=1834097 RepID=UPI0007FEBE0C|nr:serine/threonine-protein kinase [Mycobacterium sp. 852002-51163_SCH5372311]OBF86898.1 serine/threonine protein kinase [Mycobacterium sp. 852002-51163_SCH5372311]
MALASGATFAGYTIARRLGSGVTGEVYLAQDPRSARWVALKVLSLAMSSDGEFRRRFHAETPVVASLYHRHIVEVHDRGESDGQLWAATDYIEGISAAQLITERFPAVSPAGEVLSLVTAMAEALDYAHHRGLLHRDVKPANILLSSRGQGEQRMLLSDLGIARPSGTVGYAAPEQLTGRDFDGSADQYALAATAFHLLTGAPPVQPGDRTAAVDRLMNDAPPTLSDQRPELAHLDGVFSKALARNPADRFASCAEFAGAANQQAGVSVGEHSPEVAFTVEVVDYPAYAWPDSDSTANLADTQPAPDSRTAPAMPKQRGTVLQSAAGLLARRLGDYSTASNGAPRRRRVLLAGAAALLVVGVLAAGIAIGRNAEKKSSQAAGTSRSTPAAVVPPTTTGPPEPSAPVPLDGSYRIEVQRAKQTFNYLPDPQPPNVNTWWAFRSSCTPAACTASGTLLDDEDHTQAKSPGGGHIVMHFGDGQWQSEAETVQFPCVGGNGLANTQTTTQVLTLRPQPHGDFAGEMTVTVQTNECGQRAAVIRIPAVASRSGVVPPAVNVPDPGAPASTPTEAPTTPTTAPSGPGR